MNHSLSCYWFSIIVSFYNFRQLFKIQNSLIVSHQTYYDIYHGHISMKYRYEYKYSSPSSWEQRELEILWGVWAPCVFHIKQEHFNRGAEGATEKNDTR